MSTLEAPGLDLSERLKLPKNSLKEAEKCLGLFKRQGAFAKILIENGRAQAGHHDV